MSFEEWRRVILANPLLDEDASAVVLDATGRIVSLSWLYVDRATGRAENEWAGTLPELRGQGLAREAKLASIHWVAELGVTAIVTDNDVDNLPIRRLNRRLGYRELSLQREYERSVAALRSAGVEQFAATGCRLYEFGTFEGLHGLSIQERAGDAAVAPDNDLLLKVTVIPHGLYGGLPTPGHTTID